MTRGLIDLYLPSTIAYHVKVLLGAIVITIFFNLLWQGTLTTPGQWILLVAAVIQLEIFLVIARKIFPIRAAMPEPDYKRKMIVRLLIFYLIILVVSMLVLFLTIATGQLGKAGLFEIIEKFLSWGLREFFISWVVAIVIASVVFFYAEWNNALKREQRLREEKLIFRYETLKNQVNPHFLFNSLNTLSTLISKDPTMSEQFLLKLSTIYRYVLENADRNTVGLHEELDFIRDYFFLQRIRDDGKIDLLVTIDNPEDYQTLPISLQLLVENALKHNAATRENQLCVKIYLEADDLLVVENNLQKKTNMVTSSKKGLENLRERIALAMNKELIIDENSKRFLVKLPIIKLAHARVDRRR